MLDFLLRLVGVGTAGNPRARGELLSVERERVAHLFHVLEGLPHVDWEAAEAWRERSGGVALRAVAAAWLDELRDALPSPPEYWRWRHEGIEGLAPAEDAPRVARAGDRARKVIGNVLRPLRGAGPIPDVAVIALARPEDYYTFLSPHHPDEGEWATSGGVYRNMGPAVMAMIVTHTRAKWGIEETLAHELTHHALEELSLPLWVEEGFTQMMEERVTGVANFKLDREMVERQRAVWAERGVEAYLSGEGFSSPEEDVQELAYHLSQWVVRSQLSERPREFFAFAREAGELGEAESAAKHLGVSPEELVAGVVGLEGEGDSD